VGFSIDTIREDTEKFPELVLTAVAFSSLGLTVFETNPVVDNVVTLDRQGVELVRLQLLLVLLVRIESL
jgi:hypothetical protein